MPNFLHLLTLIFVVAKLMGYLTWSWWLVFTPSLISVALLIIILGVAAWAAN